MAVQIVDGLLECHHSLDAKRLVKSEIGFVGHTIGCGSVDYGLIEGVDRVFFTFQVFGNLLDVCIKSYAEK